MIGVELCKPGTMETDDELGVAIAVRAGELGVSVNLVRLPFLGGTFRITPPCVITEEQIEEALDAFDRAFEDCIQARKANGVATHGIKGDGEVNGHKAMKAMGEAGKKKMF